MAKRRRPTQLSMLTLMGEPEKTKLPFAEYKLQGLKVDEATGQVLEVTIIGPECPEYETSGDEDPWWDQAAPEETEDGQIPTKTAP